jgi:hypothetical protein
MGDSTPDQSNSKKTKVSTVVLILQSVILETEPVNIISSHKSWNLDEMLNTTGRVLYMVDSDQSNFDFY